MICTAPRKRGVHRYRQIEGTMKSYEALQGLKIPEHVAIIMDGNGRWGKAKGKKRTYGHKMGAETLEKIARIYSDAGVKYVTVYAFSTENWSRSEDEVGYLMTLMRQYLKQSIKNAKRDNMRVRVIGRREDLAEDIQASIAKLEDASKDYTGLNLQLAINYGGRDEIIRAFNRYQRASNEPLTAEVFESYLDTKGIPDPGLLVRTSGEHRTSNYLLWQLAYTEFYFIEKHWPDFSEEDVMASIQYFNKRDRRFGGIKDED